MAVTFDGRRVLRVSVPVAAIGAIATIVAIALDPPRALASYLVAWSFVTTIAIGALGFLLIGYAVSARWVAVLRRLSEVIAIALWPCAILFVPLVLGAGWVWPWVDEARGPWLSLPAFVGRSAVYLGAMIVAATVLAARSRRRDHAQTDEDDLAFDRAFACAMLPVVGLAATFGGFDWLMSLEPAWASSAFGLVVIAGALVGGLALVIAMAARAGARGDLPVRRPHFHALGRLLLAFTMVWGYVAYFQAFLIRIANLPDEVTFYVARLAGGWRAVTAILVAAHLAIPLPLLVPRTLKERPRTLAAIAILLLVAHWIDLWWMVMPNVGGACPGWIDLATLAAITGAVVSAVAWRSDGVAWVATGDPYLPESLDYLSPT